MSDIHCYALSIRRAAEMLSELDKHADAIAAGAGDFSEFRDRADNVLTMMMNFVCDIQNDSERIATLVHALKQAPVDPKSDLPAKGDV